MHILKINTEKRRLGDFGERAAVAALKKEGYRVLERNYAPEDSEIDLIAYKDGTTVFVEVKTRHISDTKARLTEPRPASAVTPAKQRSIISAAKIYLASHRDTRARFDIVEVYVEDGERGPKVADIKHLVGAFDRDSARQYRKPYSR